MNTNNGHSTTIRNAISILSLLSLVLGAGCGTIVAHGDNPGPGSPRTGVYRGVRSDWDVAVQGPNPNLIIYDVPFSAIADTFMLPHDLKKERSDKSN